MFCSHTCTSSFEKKTQTIEINKIFLKLRKEKNTYQHFKSILLNYRNLLKQMFEIT